MLKRLIMPIALSAFVLTEASSCTSVAQENVPPSGDELQVLNGVWDLTTTYANGAIAKGVRICGPALGGAYIRCDTNVVFEKQNVARQSTRYLIYNARRGTYEDIGLWEFPAGKKLTDIHVNRSGTSATGRGYIYAGQNAESRQLYEAWSISSDDLTVIIRSGNAGQPEEWPVFFTEKLTRK